MNKRTMMSVPLTSEQLETIEKASAIVMRPKSHFLKYFALKEANKIISENEE